MNPAKLIVLVLKKTKILSCLSCRLTQLAGKSKYPLHPKHLVQLKTPWFLKYIKKRDFCLDLGCGNGQNTIQAAQKCKKIIGLDSDEKGLKIAKDSANQKGIKNIKLKKQDLEKKLPFKNNTFDLMLCLDIIEHLKKRDRLLQETKRVLKNQAILLLTLPNKNTTWKKAQRKYHLNSLADPDHKIEYSLLEAKKLCRDYNFKILKILPITFDTPLSGLIDFIGGFSLLLYKKLSVWKKNKVKNNLKESTGFRLVLKNE